MSKLTQDQCQEIDQRLRNYCNNQYLNSWSLESQYIEINPNNIDLKQWMHEVVQSSFPFPETIATKQHAEKVRFLKQICEGTLREVKDQTAFKLQSVQLMYERLLQKHEELRTECDRVKEQNNTAQAQLSESNQANKSLRLQLNLKEMEIKAKDSANIDLRNKFKENIQLKNNVLRAIWHRNDLLNEENERVKQEKHRLKQENDIWRQTNSVLLNGNDTLLDTMFPTKPCSVSSGIESDECETDPYDGLQSDWDEEKEKSAESLQMEKFDSAVGATANQMTNSNWTYKIMKICVYYGISIEHIKIVYILLNYYGFHSSHFLFQYIGEAIRWFGLRTNVFDGIPQIFDINQDNCLTVYIPNASLTCLYGQRGLIMESANSYAMSRVSPALSGLNESEYLFGTQCRLLSSVYGLFCTKRYLIGLMKVNKVRTIREARNRQETQKRRDMFKKVMESRILEYTKQRTEANLRHFAQLSEEVKTKWVMGFIRSMQVSQPYQDIFFWIRKYIGCVIFSQNGQFKPALTSMTCSKGNIYASKRFIPMLGKKITETFTNNNALYHYINYTTAMQVIDHHINVFMADDKSHQIAPILIINSDLHCNGNGQLTYLIAQRQYCEEKWPYAFVRALTAIQIELEYGIRSDQLPLSSRSMHSFQSDSVTMARMDIPLSLADDINFAELPQIKSVKKRECANITLEFTDCQFRKWCRVSIFLCNIYPNSAPIAVVVKDEKYYFEKVIPVWSTVDLMYCGGLACVYDMHSKMWTVNALYLDKYRLRKRCQLFNANGNGNFETFFNYPPMSIHSVTIVKDGSCVTNGCTQCAQLLAKNKKLRQDFQIRGHKIHGLEQRLRDAKIANCRLRQQIQRRRQQFNGR